MTLLALAGALDRWLFFAAVLVSTGAAAFRVLVARRADEPSRGRLAAQAARLGLVAASLALLAALGRLPIQLVELRDPSSPLGPQAGALVTGTMWGTVWIVQVVGAALAVAAFGLARRGAAVAWGVAAMAVGCLAATPAFSGHAIGSSRWPEVAVAADVLHVTGAGLWLGAMVVLFAGLAASDATDARKLVAAFSPLALGAAAVVGVTGVFAAWLHLGSLPFLWQSRYGIALLWKLGAVGLMAGAGAFNWRRAGPALHQTGRIGPMRRSIGAELAVGALVLLATAMLVVTPPPGEE